VSDNGVLLDIKGLCVSFFTEDGIARAVQDVSFFVKKGETFALVGESGCGKSVTALSIMRLIADPPGKIVAGEIYFDGRNLLELSDQRIRAVRGNRIAMIFQEPMTSLNPVYTVGEQIVEVVRLHQKKEEAEAWDIAAEMLRKVGISDPAQRVTEYPHQMSGGMRQRVMIAMAISCKPELLIADEPTTALDVTIQAQILDLLDQLQEQSRMSILLITHNLGIVAERAENVAVMYASRIVELSDCKSLFDNPLHPYTQGLLQSLPRLGFTGKRLYTIPGIVPEPLRFPAGCKFHPRCPIGCNDKRCQTVEPQLRRLDNGRGACQSDRRVACWFAPGYERPDDPKI
jgi:peptide/nickel transport system ATP-binding protein/oligopeptide transport system ATP-binding protein